ncbi:hypothetical protein MLD38_003414 [Melastoma candidum]|uniref:Uncharacterized protein n=1 Tax=Melastoma candidum TaxID=119954 RepID=A0ACB9S1Z5_9MYRT|nr:hypothetical protein MLD38_003414 [Melastoma candidum]
MAPKGAVARRVARTSCTTAKPRKKVVASFVHDRTIKEESASKKDGEEVMTGDGEEVTTGDGCSTPKAERYKIPVVGTCPPAPKKRKPRCWSQGRKGRKQRPYFASPDLEAFFLHALGGISV